MQRSRVRRLSFLQAVNALFDDEPEEDDVGDVLEEVPPAQLHDIPAEDGDNVPIAVVDDEGDVEVFGSSEDESSEDDSDVEHVANNIVYSENPPPDRRWNRNIITDIPRNIAHAQSELEAFLFYLPEEIIRHVLRHTNRKAHDLMQGMREKPNHFSLFSYSEFIACLGILIRSGSDRSGLTSLDDLWSNIHGKPYYRAVISKNRFKFFLRVIRFDNYRTRSQRIQNDRLAAVSEIWAMFLCNLRRFYVPAATLTVDEQLLGYRGRIPGRTYMPNKPKKYGLKIFWIAEAGTGFALNGKIYSGRGVNDPVHRNLAYDVVMQLAEPFFGSGRDIVTDNFFTSHALAVSLLQKSLTLLGTIRRHRREVPSVLRQNREALSSYFLYDLNNKITLVSYAPCRNRIVTLLSSSHGRGVCPPQDPANRPQMILDYNRGKGGVDQLDENLAEFSCVRKTVRWPLLVFFNIIDVACNNAFIHLKRDGYPKTKKVFLRELSVQLATDFAKRRFQTNRGALRFHKPILQAAELFGFLPEVDSESDAANQSLGRCKVCSKVTRSRCDQCFVFLCPTHRTMKKTCLCTSCVKCM